MRFGHTIGPVGHFDFGALRDLEATVRGNFPAVVTSSG
jgi:hypothetical protein